MPLFSFEGVSPTVHPEAWIAPTATLVGNVVVEKDASIWYGVVIRADLGQVIIREGANIQDNSVIHVGNGICEVGKNATVGHQCLVHDCTVGEQALIGNGAIVLDGAVIGARTLIAAGRHRHARVGHPGGVRGARQPGQEDHPARRHRQTLRRPQRDRLPPPGPPPRGVGRAGRLAPAMLA